MARDDASGLRAALSRENLTFYFFMVICMLVGVLLLFVAAKWKHQSQESGNKEKMLIFRIGQSMSAIMSPDHTHPPSVSAAAPTESLQDRIAELITASDQDGAWADVLRDFGIAVLIAVFVTVVIDVHTSNRLREHISYDVLSAAYAKVVPEKIYTQIADSVFRSDVYRRNWEAHIDVVELDLSAGIAVITATYSYDLENLNERRVPYEVLAAVSLDVPIPDRNIPKFNSVTITDEHNKSLVDANADETKAVLATPPSAQNEPVIKRNLTLKRTSQEMQLVAQVHIPPRRNITVRYQVERAIRVPGQFVLNATAPADGIKIITRVNGFKLFVVPLHPDAEALRHPQPDTWQFDAGILPWQGFRFIAEV